MRRKRLKGGALVFSGGLAVAFAFAAPFAPWYSISSNVDHWTIQNSTAQATFNLNGTTTFFPGSEYRFECTTQPITAPIWGPICSETQQAPGGLPQPYSASSGLRPSSLGALYSMAWLLSVTTFALGTVGFALLIDATRRRHPDWRIVFATALALMTAGSVALGAGLGLGLLQPAAAAHDFGSSGFPRQVGAGSSFWGSCGPSPVQCGGQASGNLTVNDLWGPALGWYVEVAAGALFLALGALVVRQAIRLRTAPYFPPSHPTKP
ncbi:MAG: hypothetical protein L3K14_09290 [Thermoplasmata archaeon]|nr:hypothetical protein [Thermoplasmata archaeon]